MTAQCAALTKGRPLKRLWRVVVEVFGHTHFKGRPFVNAAHWAVMVEFLFGILVWFEAYIQTFAQPSVQCILNSSAHVVLFSTC